MTARRSWAAPSPAKRDIALAASWWTLRPEVSRMTSASERSSPSRARSRWMPSSSRPDAWSGCGRRTLSNRRTRASSVASRKTTDGRCPARPSSATIWPKSANTPWLRTSTTAATRWIIGSGVRARYSSWSCEQLREHLRREVVDDVPAEVLQDVGHRRAAGPAHPGEDEHRLVAGGRAPTGAEGSGVGSSLIRLPPRGASVEHLAGRHVNGRDGLRRAASARAASRWCGPGPGRCPGPAAISSTDAARSRLTDPNWRSSALRRTSPRPGMPSRTEVVMALDRRCRWKVMANRCASSRTRCSR